MFLKKDMAKIWRKGTKEIKDMVNSEGERCLLSAQIEEVLKGAVGILANILHFKNHCNIFFSH